MRKSIELIIETIMIGLFGIVMFAMVSKGGELEVINDNVSPIGHIYKIDGYFTHYGDGPFDWMYLSNKTGNAYKLEGMDSNTGYLKWRKFNFKDAKAIRIDDFIVIDYKVNIDVLR